MAVKDLFIQLLVPTQFMRLSKLEPEPLLQPDLNLSGNVATKRLGDLWQPDHQLHQRDSRATQTEVPKLNGEQGAHIVAHQGALANTSRVQSDSSGPSLLQRL